MPELPEVETLRRFLVPKLTGLTVEKIMLMPSRLTEANSVKTAKQLANIPLKTIARRGKYLLFHFATHSLILHLGMSGRLQLSLPGHRTVSRRQSLPERKNPRSGWRVFHPPRAKAAAGEAPARLPHCYLTLSFKDKTQLNFFDPRTFGKLLLLPTPAVALHPRIKKLGLEPLEQTPAQRSKTLKALKKLWPLRSSRSIKTLLLEQSFIAGVGNIYADESLFLAKIAPTKTAKTLTQLQWQRLVKAIRKVLRLALKKNGTSFSDFKKPDGKKGAFQEVLLVYGREGLPCLRCGTTLRKLILNQRSCAFCPHCQTDEEPEDKTPKARKLATE